MKCGVSVIMPCYNASMYLAEAIHSVQNQSYGDWELLVIDDGSTDNSVDVVKKYAQEDNRIKLIQQSNSGACRARNNGIDHAEGDYIKFLDADDLLEDGCLECQVRQVEKLNARQIPFGDYNNVDRDGRIISKYVFNREHDLKADPVYFFFSEWRVLISAPLHRTALLREIGGFNEELKRGQESDLHLRLALADVEFVHMSCLTFRYREHHANTRISEKLKVGTKGRSEYYLQRAQICERLLCDKYGSIPEIYKSYFANTWFSRARILFAGGNKPEGMDFLRKAYGYGLQNRFQRFYYFSGKIFGYILLEKLFQLRLKVVNKK